MELLRPTYELRPGDQIVIRAFEMEDISDRPFQVDGDGFVNLPTLGRLRAGGLTAGKFEAVLVDLLKKYVRVPQVTVTIVGFSSQPVFFVGAFKNPGIYPLQGRRTLVEMISSIGGFLPSASRRVKVTRRKEFGRIPLDNAVESPERNVSTVDINMTGLRENVSPAEDIVLMAFDVISVEKAEMIYINGEVGKVGAVELQDKDSISIIQALTMAGGLTPAANPKTVWILRPVLDTSRRAEIPVDLEKILAGKESDRPLLPNDVLYIPKQSGIKRNLGRTLLIAVPTVVSAVGIGVALTR
jgi:polysaccharide export outer membrane protein